ncbi:MAG TPA: RusA family crossover junction endodeoxyribonuclease [Acidobacteriaceae bacterium]
MRVLRFSIPGRLGAWSRAGRNTASGITFTPKEMKSDQATVKQFAVLAMRDQCKTQLVGPLRMVVHTWRQPPESWSHKKKLAAVYITTKPDFDNTLKLIADALNHVAYWDDAQIADGHHIKRYSMTMPEQVIVALEELEEQ